MHVLAAQSGVIGDSIEPVDLAQEPGDIVVISAADSELAALAKVHDAQCAHDGIKDAPSLRLANFMALTHNYSVDLYVEKTLVEAKLIVLRLLGGSAYWPYGLEQIAALAREKNIKLAVLPGDAKPDTGLLAHSTLSQDETQLLWGYLTQGGPENMDGFLQYCAHLIGMSQAPPAPRPLLKAGLYWPDATNISLDDLRNNCNFMHILVVQPVTCIYDQTDFAGVLDGHFNSL